MTPPFCVCNINAGAPAAVLGSGSELRQKKTLVCGAGILAQTHLE